MVYFSRILLHLGSNSIQFDLMSRIRLNSTFEFCIINTKDRNSNEFIQVSISSTLNVRIFHTNVVLAAFLQLFLRTYVEKKLPKWRSYEIFARIMLMKLNLSLLVTILPCNYFGLLASKTMSQKRFLKFDF